LLKYSTKIKKLIDGGYEFNIFTIPDVEYELFYILIESFYRLFKNKIDYGEETI